MPKYFVFKINMVILNVLSLLILLFMYLITILISPAITINLFKNFNIGICFLLLCIFYFISHELLHALGYIIHGADYKKLTFGVELEKGVFYCLCKQDISRKNILMSLVYPFVIIGIITYILSIVFNLPILLLLSILNISGAAGDILYFLFIIKLNKNVKFSELDDGMSFAILSNEDISKYKHFGLVYNGVKKSIPREDFKLIKISKFSIAVFIIYIFILLAMVIFN